jgi:hypothetical protein
MRRTGEAATIRANLGARIPTAEDMERLNREVVRGWEANCEADEVMEPAPNTEPPGALLLENQRSDQELAEQARAEAVEKVRSRSKFDEQEDD